MGNEFRGQSSTPSPLGERVGVKGVGNSLETTVLYFAAFLIRIFSLTSEHKPRVPMLLVSNCNARCNTREPNGALDQARRKNWGLSHTDYDPVFIFNYFCKTVELIVLKSKYASIPKVELHNSAIET